LGSGAAVADLGQQRGRGDDALAAAEQRAAEDLAVGVLADSGRDPARESRDLACSGLGRCSGDASEMWLSRSWNGPIKISAR
jgi:hypothetical protein